MKSSKQHKSTVFLLLIFPSRQNFSENKKVGHHSHTMGYVCANFCLCTVSVFWSNVWRIICPFYAYFWHFLKILPQLQNFSQKTKCVHHPHTRRHLCAKSDVLRLSQSWDIARYSLFCDPWTSAQSTEEQIWWVDNFMHTQPRPPKGQDHQICMLGDFPDIITHVKFDVNRFRGFIHWRSEIQVLHWQALSPLLCRHYRDALR